MIIFQLLSISNPNPWSWVSTVLSLTFLVITLKKLIMSILKFEVDHRTGKHRILVPKGCMGI